MAKRQKMVQIRKLNKNIPKIAVQVCETMLKDLERAKRAGAVGCKMFVGQQ